MTQTSMITQTNSASLTSSVSQATAATHPLPLTPGQLAQVANNLAGNSAAVATTSLSSGDMAQKLLPGRLLEQLLLNPQTIPQAELRQLRQVLHQQLATADKPAEQLTLYPIVASLLNGADGLPLINPQLQQQLEGKQSSSLGGQSSQQPSLTSEEPSGDFAVSVRNIMEEPKFPGSSLPAAPTDISSELQQLAMRLVSQKSTVIPEHHQLLLLATLLLDNQESPITNLDPRARRRLAQQLALAIKNKLGSSSSQEAGFRAESVMQQVTTRSAVNRSLLGQLPVGERWSDTDDESESLPTELMWPGLASAPPQIKPAQLETVLGNLLDKQFLGVSGREGVQQLVSHASMDQLLMVVSTLMIKVNSTMAQSVLDSQKINKSTSDRVMQNQLQKQIEEFEKAQEAQEKAKKAGIFGQIFNWIVAAASVVVAVVTMNPIAIVGAIAQLVGTALESVAFIMGENAPPWLQKLGMGLQIGGAILTLGVGLLKSAAKIGVKAVTTIAQQGLKAALSQGLQTIIKAMTQAIKRLVEWVKSALSKLQKTGEVVIDGGKQMVQKSVTALKNPKQAVKQAWEGSKQGAEKLGDKIKHPEKLISKAETVKKVAEGVSTVARSTSLLVGNIYDIKHNELQAKIKHLQNDSWLLDMILEYYQKQSKQMHHIVADLYQQQGETTAMVSEQLKENAGVQNRIASRLA